MVMPCSRSALQTVGEQRKIDTRGRAIDAALGDGGELVFVDRLGVMQQAADERRLAVVHAAGRGEAQHLLVEMVVEELLELGRGLRHGLLIHNGNCGNAGH